MHSDHYFTLIVGAPKCGTTSLFTYLSQHPQVAPCHKKEPNFFSDDEVWNRGWEWYCQLWDMTASGVVTALEASPSYTVKAATSAERIASVQADFRFIYMMRNPLERVESAFYHNYYRDGEKKHDSQEDAFKSLLPKTIGVSKYAENIKEYYQRFSSESILLLQLEDLKHNPTQMMRRICQFLEIDDAYQFADLNKVHNRRNSYREDTTWRKLTQIKQLKSLANLVPESYKTGLRTLLSQPPKDSKNVPPSLTEQQKELIKQELKDDLKQLSLDYGVDISKWGIHL